MPRNGQGRNILARRGPQAALLAALALLTAAAVWWLPAGPWRQPFVFLLLWLWPTLTWAGVLPGPVGARLLSAAGLALLLNALLALLLHYVPGPVPRAGLLLAALVVTLAPLLPPRRRALGVPGSGRPKVWVAAIMLLALALRLPNMGYKELQGDEGIIMERAAAALTGDDAELFLHQKGPVEILIPLAGWGLAGASDEFWARLPFTWAAWLAAGALLAVTWRQHGRPAALAAGLLFAVAGFGIAFARIVQYQSLVLLWGALALLHAARFRRQGQAADLLLASVFLGGGLLAHYDAVLAAPAIGWLLLPRQRRERGVAWHAWAAAALSGALIVAVFYVPFALNPAFARTGRYLLGDRIGGSALSWSGPAVWRMVTFYNSTTYVVGLILLALAGLWLLWRERRGAATILYLAVPLLFYTLIVADPRTHVYTVFPGATMAAGSGAAGLWARVRTRPARAAGALLWGAFVAASAFYVYLLFVDAPPERQRHWAEQQPALYPTTWREPPLYGLFGFPHQAGWRVASRLVDAWPYASNEEEAITAWYMAQAPRTYCADYETFLVADAAQDAVPYDRAALDDLYLQQVVTVYGRPSLHIYGRQPTDRRTIYEATTAHLWRTPEQVAPAAAAGRHPVDVTLGGQVRLVSYDLDVAEARPGGQIAVTLYWEALAPFARNYQTFVHLYNGTLYAQHDGGPHCDMRPTSGWEAGEIIADPHLVTLPEDMPPGKVPLLAGMYDLLSQERLPVTGSSTDVIHLQDVTIGP